MSNTDDRDYEAQYSAMIRRMRKAGHRWVVYIDGDNMPIWGPEVAGDTDRMRMVARQFRHAKTDASDAMSEQENVKNQLLSTLVQFAIINDLSPSHLEVVYAIMLSLVFNRDCEMRSYRFAMEQLDRIRQQNDNPSD